MNESERELLERARTALSPTSARRDALRARIDAALATPPSSGGGGMLGVGGAVAIFIAVGLGAGGVAWLARSPESAVPEVSATESAAVEPAERIADTEALEPALVEPPLEPAEVTPEPEPAVERRDPARRRPSELASAPTDEPDALTREIAIVGEARRALARGDGAAANEALERHAREFPEGALAEERSALAVLAWCASGQDARAVVAARAFVSRYPASLSLARVRASCAGSAL